MFEFTVSRTFTLILSLVSLNVVLCQSQKQEPVAWEQPETSCLTLNDSVPVANSVRSDLYRGQQAFTVALLDAINTATPHENVFFSPYSTFHALLLAYFGSNGKTEAALKTALQIEHIDNKFQIFNAYRSQEATRLKRARNTSVEFSSADKIYVSQQTRLRSCMSDLFHSELETLDFASQPDECRIEINEWISNQTKGNIKDILTPGSISSNTNLVLANAAYFKADWSSKFDENATTKEIFYAASDKVAFVDMMYQKGTFNHATNEHLGCHILELPYLGEENGISMYILLPTFGVNSLEDLLGNLTTDILQQALNEGMAREIEVKIPRFTFEKRLQIRNVLEKIGVGNLFTDESDLSGFSKESKLKLDDAIHQAKIVVNEKGSEAAAATVLFSFRSSRPLEPTQFFCNHPFLFLIYDNRSQAVLFAGIYRDPEN